MSREYDNGDAEMEIGDEEEEPENLDEFPPDEMVSINDDSTHLLNEHKKDVFSLTFSSEHNLLVSGAEDDSAIVWEFGGARSFGDLQKTAIKQHEDSVIEVNFNHDDSLFATADMSGRIFIHETKSRSTLFEINECNDLEWTVWHPSCNILFAGASDGSVFMFLLGKTQVERSKVFLTNTSAACTIGNLLPDGKNLLCGYDDGRVCMWELKDGSHRDVSLQSPCRSMDVHSKLSVAAVGIDNGQTALINTSNMSVIVKLTNNTSDKNKEDEFSVETVKFAPEQFPWLAVGTANGLLTIFDFESGKPRHECTHDEMAVVKCQWLLVGSDNLRIITACIDGGLRGWDAKSGEPVFFKSGGGHEIFDFSIAHLFNQLVILTACAEGAIRVFPYVEESQQDSEIQ
ncbi:Angio-associated migratory cell protein [Aphelenchoides besseyi]|nr:Angio-associated migratory cell protein [Aphelenchoides besseyi]KAI6200635.1 Angio-associated migratory cell protein [Aphelenchoides besseyi]